MASPTSSIDAGEDFEGYMDHIQRQQAEAEQMKEMLRRHEIWRQTTWSGWLVRQIQAVGNHLAPFFEAVSDAFQKASASDSISVRILFRIAQVTSYVLFLYALATLVNIILGGKREPIVVEQEIIVEVEEEAEEEEDAAAAEKPRQSARDKKDK